MTSDFTELDLDLRVSADQSTEYRPYSGESILSELRSTSPGSLQPLVRAPLHVVGSALQNSPRTSPGFERETKEAEREVGSWNLDIAVQDDGGACAGRISAVLHACAGPVDNSRINGAYLNVQRWVVGPGQDDKAPGMYRALVVATLQRLRWLMKHGVRSARGPADNYSLRILDQCPANASAWSMSTLEGEFTEQLQGGGEVPGIFLQVTSTGGQVRFAA